MKNWYYKARQLLQNKRDNSYQKLLRRKVHQVLQSVTEVYYKVHQVLQSVTRACCCFNQLQSCYNFL